MRSTTRKSHYALAAAMSLALIACSDAGLVDELVGNDDDGGDIPAAYAKFNDDVSVASDGEYVVIQTSNLPDHKSPYYSTNDSRYEAYNGDNANFQLNPNQIAAQDLTFRIPKNPQEADNKEATPLGPIGVAVNGVAIFNQYAGPDRPLTDEVDSFDQYNGHPQQTGQYHYHVEPQWLTAAKGKDALIGFLLDGFPVYGPIEDGTDVDENTLDAYHGHSGQTAEYPDGIYHYHVTHVDPYINGAGFFGEAGTISR